MSASKEDKEKISVASFLETQAPMVIQSFLDTFHSSKNSLYPEFQHKFCQSLTSDPNEQQGLNQVLFVNLSPFAYSQLCKRNKTKQKNRDVPI